MSRGPVSSQRSLTLTEELEKLEQSITLTLQANKKLTITSIVRIELSPRAYYPSFNNMQIIPKTFGKFWKQFFEASANVSLNGYEEQPADGETEITEEDTSHATPSSSSYTSPPQQESTFSPTSAHKYVGHGSNQEDESSLFDPDSVSTPRPPRSRQEPPTMATYDSPYETLRRQIQGNPEEETPTSTIPSTPRGQTLSESMVNSSPLAPPSTTRNRTPANDVLLHRVLDKNYRIQATPHTQTRLPRPGAQNNNVKTPLTGRRRKQHRAQEDLDSSPLIEAPQLHAEIFDSPGKVRRVPGVSVLTPAKKIARKDPSVDNEETKRSKAAVWDSDSDDEGWPEGMSPPKTMQFHIPQSKLLKTPAREASKRIVEDLLLTAGGDVTDDYDPDSPSVVGGLLEEDTF